MDRKLSAKAHLRLRKNSPEVDRPSILTNPKNERTMNLGLEIRFVVHLEAYISKIPE
jgi:hypothetical protein